MSESGPYDPVEWSSANWLYLNFGLSPYKIKCLLLDGKVRTRLDHTRSHKMRYNVADVKKYLRERSKQQKPSKTQVMT